VTAFTLLAASRRFVLYRTRGVGCSWAVKRRRSPAEPEVKSSFSTTQQLPQQNTLLGALSAADCEHLAKDLELVPLPLGEVLYESGETMSHAYFPIDGIISLLYVMKNGESAEIAVVGNEGMIGIALFMGGESTMSRAIVQNAGHAYRMKAEVLKDEFHRGGALSRLLLMFASALITQMVQTAACNRHHTVDQQLCRWMLLSLDRLPSTRISMTEKLIGNMLGIDRAKVSEATGVLDDAGLVHYDNGEITVLDRPGVERRTCECYGVVKKESDRLLPSSVAKVNV
jgi:CRP-like cAMP-binding protein